jgi:hypothetical protein
MCGVVRFADGEGSILGGCGCGEFGGVGCIICRFLGGRALPDGLRRAACVFGLPMVIEVHGTLRRKVCL